MTVAGRMVIELVADPTGIKAGMEHAEALIRGFARTVGNIEVPTGSVSLGEKMAAEMIAGLRNKLEAREGNLARAFLSDNLDEEEFKKAGIQARLRFNEGILNARNSLQAQGLLSKDVSAVLTRELDVAAKLAENKMEASLAALQKKNATAALFDPRLASAATGAATTQAARETDKLLKSASASFDTAIVGAKLKLAAGGFPDPKGYDKAGQQASAAFNAALTQGFQRISGLKGFNDNIRDTIVDNLKITGRLSADALGNALNRGLVGSGNAAGNQFAKEFISNATQANRLAGVARTMTLAISGPIIAGGVAALHAAKGVDDAMLALRARTTATQGDLADLANQARDLARTSNFGVAQIGEAQLGLATRGGLNTRDVLKATQPVMALAASQQIDLSRATEITTETMRQFNLTSSDTPRIVDQFVRAAQLGGTTVEEFSTALRLAGPAAHESGLSLQETLAVLADFSRAGVVGQRAGQSLVGMLKSLQDPTKQEALALRRMNVDILDSSGKIRPLSVIIAELQGKLTSAGQTFAQFGQRAGVGAGALVALGGTQLRTFEQALEGAGGAAQRAADIQLSGFSGALQRLTAALSAFGVAVAQSGLLRVIEQIIGVLTTMARGFASVPEPILTFVSTLLAFVAIAGPTIYAVAKITAGINVLRATMAIATGATGITGLIAKFGQLAGVLGVSSGVLLGLAAVAAAIYFAGSRARDAADDLARYRLQLQALSETNVGALESERRSQQQSLDAQTQARDFVLSQLRERADRTGANMLTLLAFTPQGREVGKMNDTIAKTAARLQEVDAKLQSAKGNADAFSKASSDLAAQLALIGKASDKFPVDFNTKNAPKGPTAVDIIIAKTKQAVDQFQLLREVQDDASKRSAQTGFFPATIAPTPLVRALRDMRADADGLAAALAHVPDPLGKGAEDAARLMREMINVNRQIDEAQRQLNFTQTTDRNAAHPISLVPQSAVVSINAQINTGASSGIRKMFGDLESPVLRVTESLDAMSHGLNGALPALGSFLDGLSRLGNSVQTVATTIANPGLLVSKTSAGNVDVVGTAGNIAGAIGTVGAAVSTVASVISIFTAESRHQREIQQQNLDELRKLRATTELQAKGANALTAARAAVNVALNTPRANGSSLAVTQGNALLDALLKSGLSLDALSSIAEQFGIKLIDNGRLVTGSLDALNQALAIATENVGHFTNSLSDQERKQALVQNVNDVAQTPQQIIKNAVAIFTQFDAALAPVFAGLNADTADGRAAIKAALKNLVNIIATTGLTAEQLGNFQSLDDLLSVLDTMEGAFDDLANTTKSVTEALSNVPQGFRVALRTFQATTPVTPVPTLTPRPVAPPTFPTTPIAPSAGGIPLGAIVDNSSVNFSGPVRITPGDGESAKDAFDSFVRIAKNRARGRGLPAANWPAEV